MVAESKTAEVEVFDSAQTDILVKTGYFFFKKMAADFYEQALIKSGSRYFSTLIGVP